MNGIELSHQGKKDETEILSTASSKKITPGREEYFDLLDASGHKTGQTKLRSEVHRDGDWHRAVCVWIINQNGEILLQRRAKYKDSHPGLLDISVGGHLQAGDEPLQAAVREVREEIGLDIPPEDFFMFFESKSSTVPHPGFLNNSFFNSYLVRTDKTVADMTAQQEEVSELKFVPFLELKHMIESHDPDLVPHPGLYQAMLDLLEPELGKKHE